MEKNLTIGQQMKMGESICLEEGHSPFSVAMVDDFFESVSSQVAQFWPLNFEEEGYKTHYFKVEKYVTQAGLVENLLVCAEVLKNKERYILKTVFEIYDEQMKVELASVERKSKEKSIDFAGVLLEKMQKF